MYITKNQLFCYNGSKCHESIHQNLKTGSFAERQRCERFSFPHGDSAEETFSGFMKQEDISSFSPLGLGWNTIDSQRMSTAQIHPFSDVYDVF